MTTTLVLGKSTDGYLHSYDPAYATSRTGPADAVNGGNTGYYGQNNNAGQFASFQAFIGFDYAAIPATEVVTACEVRGYTNVALSASLNRSLELRGYAWSPGGLIVGDWRNATTLAAATLFGQVFNINQSGSKWWLASTDELTNIISTVTSMEFVVTTSRQRAGTQPTSDEGMAMNMSEAEGTTLDPLMSWTTVTRSRLVPVMGASVELSDGAWVHLLSSGTATPVITLNIGERTGGSSGWGTLATGTGAAQFANAFRGAQALALAVDAADNLYVLGRVGNAENTLACQAYIKGSGHTWTPGTLRTAAMPAYDGTINQVAAAWHNVAGGTIMAVVGHQPGTGAASNHSQANADLSYVLLSSAYLLTGTGSLVRGTGNAAGTLVSNGLAGSTYNGYTNEVGTSLDVVAAEGANPAWGWVGSLTKLHQIGENHAATLGRYIINATGTGLEHASYVDNDVWALKDGNSKLRVVRLTESTCAFVTADQDSGYGITVIVMQFSGTEAGGWSIGYCNLDGEGITSMPLPTTLARTMAWDVVYNAVENRLWIYYVDKNNPLRMMRTAVSLDSYQPVRNEVQAGLFGDTIQGIRAPRNAVVTDKCMITVAYITGGGVLGEVAVTDQFNLAPTAPTLTPRANYDASLAATFAWTFNDPNPGDTQSAYQLQVVDVALGTTALDTGKVASTTSSRNVAGATLTNGKSYQWRVMTWDAADAAGAWSGYGTFSTSAGGTVTITDPVADNPPGVVTDEYGVDWSVSGTTQASYRVILTRNDTGAVVSDSNWVASAATTHLITGMLTDIEHTVSVQVRNAALVLSGIGTRKITPSYATPEVPLISVSPQDEDGYVLVQVDNPLPGQPLNSAVEWTFESGIGTGWYVASGTWDVSTEQAHQGTQSGKLTTTGTPTQAYVRANSAPVVVDQRYTCRAWVYSPVARSVTASIDWLTNGGATYQATSAQATAVAANTWTLVQATGTCPAGATHASYGPTLAGNPATGSVVYCDELALVSASDRPDVVANQILRREAGQTGPWRVVATIPPDGSFKDYTGTSGVVYEYKARGITA